MAREDGAEESMIGGVGSRLEFIVVWVILQNTRHGDLYWGEAKTAGHMPSDIIN
jgi:hypothetical protein